MFSLILIMYSYHLFPLQVLAQQHDTLDQYWVNVGPPSTTSAQHLPNMGPMSRVCWEVTRHPEMSGRPITSTYSIDWCLIQILNNCQLFKCQSQQSLFESFILAVSLHVSIALFKRECMSPMSKISKYIASNFTNLNNCHSLEVVDRANLNELTLPFKRQVRWSASSI